MLRRSPNSKKAFTLLELIVVIVILGILAALAIPTFAGVIDRTKDETAGISLASAARNAQAINGFEAAEGFSITNIDKAVRETVGQSQAFTPGEQAAASTFSLAPESLSVTPGAKGTASTRYAEVGLALSENSGIMALSMRSTTGRCVWVKAEATTGTLWQVSKDALESCDSTFGLTISGSNGGTVSGPGDGGGSAEGPGDNETPPAGGDGSTPILIDPNDPDSLPITGNYCVDNNCADPSLLGANVLSAKNFGTETGFRGLTADADHQQLIAVKADGIYFVDLQTEATRLVYSAVNGDEFKDAIYFRGGYLFVNDGKLFQKFRVTSSGVTLVDDKLVELTQVTESGYAFETYAWSATSMAGDVVGTGAQLYFTGHGGVSLTGEYTSSAAYDYNYIGKFDINGKMAPQPVAYFSTLTDNRLDFCSVSADANYLYIQASSASDSAFPENGQKAGIWRISKNSENVDLNATEPWLERPVGCGTHNGTEEFAAVGGKLFMSNGKEGVVSIDTVTKKETLLVGDGQAYGIKGGFMGAGREVAFERNTEEVPGMVMYKNKLYVTTGPFSASSPIYALEPATASVNDMESRNLNVGSTATLLAELPSGTFEKFAFNPSSNMLNVSSPTGSYALSPNGAVEPKAGTSDSSWLRGTNLIFGNRVFQDSESSSMEKPGLAYSAASVTYNGESCDSWSSYSGNSTRDKWGTPWCLERRGFISHETPTYPQLHPISNGDLLFNENGTPADGFQALGISVTGTDAYLVTSKPGAPGQSLVRVYYFDLSKVSPSPTLIAEIPDFAGLRNPAYGISFSASDIYLPSTAGVVKISKNGGYTLQVSHPANAQEGDIRQIAHDGKSLYFVTSLGKVYKVD